MKKSRAFIISSHKGIFNSITNKAASGSSLGSLYVLVHQREQKGLTVVSKLYCDFHQHFLCTLYKSFAYQKRGGRRATIE